MNKQEEIDNKIKREIQNGDTETLEEMAQTIKDEDIEPPNIKTKKVKITIIPPRCLRCRERAINSDLIDIGMIVEKLIAENFEDGKRVEIIIKE